jgi:ATP-dependent Clp protease protease subunit
VKDLESLPKLRIRGVIMPQDESQPFGESFSAADVVDFLEQHKSDPEFVVEISSDGGSVSEGKEIYSRLKQSGKKITTVTYKARSIATLFMLTGQKRLIVEGADFLIHPARVYGEDFTGPLLSEDLFKIGKEVAIATEEILDIYCRALGEDKRNALMVAMGNESDLGAREAIKLGFANGYYKKEAPTAASHGGILITDHIQELIKNNMSKDTDNKDLLKTIEDKIANGFKSLAKRLGKVRNEITLSSGGKQIYVVPVNPDTPDDLTNAKVFEVDDAGLPTEISIADGEHVLDDGRTIVVLGGLITEVKEAIDAKKLQEENAALAAEKVALTEKLAALESAHAKEVVDLKAEMKKEFDGIQMAFSEFKKAVPGERKKEEDPIITSNKKMTINDIRVKMEEDKKLNIV